LVLDKNSGALLKTTGSVASILSQPVSARESTEEVDAGTKAMEEVAAMVWNFVTGAGDLVHTLDDEVWLSHHCRTYHANRVARTKSNFCVCERRNSRLSLSRIRNSS